MSTGLYQDHEVIERFVSGAVSATTLAQVWVAPFDCDVLGLILNVGTAPGGTSGVSVNGNVSPTSQTGGPKASVGAYNLWTAANLPTVLGTKTNNLTVVQNPVVQNSPYALNYPLPGPSGTTGYVTAQSTSQTTQSPVTAPPTIYNFGLNPLYGSVAPDNTYTDYNGFTGVPASLVHAGDVVSFVIAAAGAGLGSAANLQLELVVSKR